jgi:hypothetical protein
VYISSPWLNEVTTCILAVLRCIFRMFISALLTHVAFCKALSCRFTNGRLLCGGESPRRGSSETKDAESAVDEEGSSVVAM